MNSVKIAYLVMATVENLALLAAAVLIPVYVTPGYYWWSAFLIALMLLGSEGAVKRMNSWADFGVNE